MDDTKDCSDDGGSVDPLRDCTPELHIRHLPSDEGQVIHLNFRWDFAENKPLVLNIDGRELKDGMAHESWNAFCDLSREEAELLKGFLTYVLSFK